MLSLPLYVQSLRRDVRFLRIHNALLVRSAKISTGTITTLKEEIRKLKQEQGILRKEQERLRKEKESLEKEIDHLLTRPSTDPTTLGLQHRLKEQRDGLIRALVVTPNGTNNFAEQELRPITLARKISYGSDTYAGMETTAILSSVVQTLVRTKREEFFSTLKAYLHTGFANS